MINQDKQHFQEIGHLGFGLMRLPKAAGSDSEIDLEQTKAMVDHFMAAGLNYFDTALLLRLTASFCVMQNGISTPAL